MRLAPFIVPLLKDYCAALQADIEDEGGLRYFQKRKSFIDDLLQSCIATERYDELEILLQECRSGFRETRASSPDDDFWVWYQVEDGAQAGLAKLCVPGSSLYWEDSRTYMRTWDSLEAVRADVLDPMPSFPYVVTVRPERIEYENVLQAAKLRNSERVAVLERKRRAGD